MRLISIHNAGFALTGFACNEWLAQCGTIGGIIEGVLTNENIWLVIALYGPYGLIICRVSRLTRKRVRICGAILLDVIDLVVTGINNQSARRDNCSVYAYCINNNKWNDVR